MKKFCPNCGKKIQPDDKFCPHCGYDLTSIDADEPQSQDSPQSTRAERREQQPNNHHQRNLIITIIVVVLIIVIGGLWFMHQQQSNSTNNSTSSSSSSQTTNQASNANNNSSSNNDDDNEDKISSSIGPKETVAAITVYAANHGSQDWKALLDNNSDLTVKLDSDNDDLSKLNEPGAGMAYEVFGYHDVDSDDDTEFVYTLSKDNTVNIYKIDDGFDDSDGNLDPVESVSKSSIINWLNHNGYADKVKSMTDNVDMDD